MFETYPVEKTSQAIQGTATTATSSARTDSTSSIETSEPLNSLHLYEQGPQESEPPKEAVDNRSPQFGPSVPLVPTVDESWASEFQRKDSEGMTTEMESGIIVGGSVGVPETDDGVSHHFVVSKERPPDILFIISCLPLFRNLSHYQLATHLPPSLLHPLRCHHRRSSVHLLLC